ncbi:Periplasmic pH-dependent serine endoprotease DegQ precursor [Nonomuraea coxensis DSM 45129]|uniref:Periplasmic pH-dependent serine endoprotease DegQ n=1 Tax=Nonomuraea coxensis DSM 45129 TaxID=1122611 RepID=A0ABX8TWN0_9ACTN|nr:trypsin-like peptidase domain-containing protein [Nonomuraea coxensis]QYC38924.1 Periplasmic pH-dependent serine endoprotease DegQ precursor [Nonomuraea coxensis DSM 45129]
MRQPTRETPLRRTAAALAAAAVLLAGCGPLSSTGAGSPAATPAATSPATTPATPPGATGTQGPTGTAQGLEAAYEQVIANVLPSIVQINTKVGLGSGIVFDDAGHIVTNAHVVGEATEMSVAFATGGAERKARLVRSFAAGDLAVIKVENADGLRPATFGDSTKVRVGQIVLAMGNPLGLSGSVTEGIVSAVGRTITEPQESGSPGATIANAIQTSASINPGNSGGALVNLSGQVIGIPTLTATNPDLGGGAAPGIGFAIPGNTAVDIAEQIIKNGKVTNSHRAALGIRGSTVLGEDGRPSGVGVARVEPDGGAAKAGIKTGDVIVSVNDKKTPTIADLTETIAALQPGTKVKVGLIRADGSPATVEVTLGELPVD